VARHESILVFEDRPAYNRWLGHLNSVETAFTVHRLGGSDIIVTATAATHGPVADALPAPRAIVGAATGFRLARRELFPEGITVPIGTATVGDGNVAVFAGPCAVESREQLLSTAMWVESHGAVGLRGGAFKPRTSPYSFQGLRWDALDLLAEARSRTGLPVLTEVIEPGHVERLAELTDAFQVGARNMQNFSLLTELGRAGKPVVLKRGFGTTMAELLAAS